MSQELNREEDSWIRYDGGSGAGKGKHIVFVSGDEEYRSEEALPMLARIMAIHHGFKCTVLFAIDRETGLIDPGCQTNIPGLHHLADADMMVLFTRFRELPDEQMKHIVDYTESGKPIMGLRTATHAFKYSRDVESPYAKYSFDNDRFKGGYGRQVLGETWINHHGAHGKESSRGIVDDRMADHPILKGVDDIWGPSDVYGVTTPTGEAKVLVHGQPLVGMEPSDPPNQEKSTMPMAWIKSYKGEKGNTSRVFCTTMGASVDLLSEGLRRLLVNGCYWGMEMEDRIAERSRVDFIGEYLPTFYAVGKYKRGVRPSDFSI